MKQPGEQDIADLFDAYLRDSATADECEDVLPLVSDETWDGWQATMREFCERENIHWYIRDDGTIRREP